MSGAWFLGSLYSLQALAGFALAVPGQQSPMQYIAVAIQYLKLPCKAYIFNK